MRFTDENEVIGVETYQAILVGIELDADITYSMEELGALAEAAGVVVLGQMVQSRERPDKATFIGKGKVDELEEYCKAMEADTVIFNDELSGMQIRNLEERLNVRVIDRTILILDIFASRAVSKEGKLQVEFAQLKYRLPRLTGFGKSLSRLGAGIGTRGPGEKKLETDRRHIKSRMDEINRELREIKESRAVQRARREKNSIPVVALVGYTNSGKSATMNRILEDIEKEEKAVFEKDMLFATLDTFQRRVKLDSNHEFILVDTVGFVSKLPHALVQAFRSTLEEVVLADLLLHIVDSAYDEQDFHIEVVNTVLAELGAGEKEKLLVYNKIDLLDDRSSLTGNGVETINISAKTGENMDILIKKIKEKIFSDHVTLSFLIPFDKGNIVSHLCEKAHVISQDFTEDGTRIVAEVTGADAQRFEAYIVGQ